MDSAFKEINELMWRLNPRIRATIELYMTDECPNDYVLFLLNILQSENPLAKVGASHLVGWLKITQAVEILKKNLSDPDQRIRLAAALALYDLLDDAQSIYILESMVMDEDEAISRTAICKLMDYGEQGFETLISILTNSPSTVRELVMLEIAEVQVRKPEIVSELLPLQKDKIIQILTSIVRDSEDRLIGLAANALGRLKADKALPVLIESLAEPSLSLPTRIRIVQSLGILGNVSCIKPLLSLLSTPETVLLREVITTLGTIGGASTVDPLLAIFSNSSKKRVVGLDIALAIGQIGDPRSVPLLYWVIENERFDTNDRDLAYILLSNILSKQ